MIAGTIGLLDEPADKPVESYAEGGDVPALDVQETQTTFADRPVQSGEAAERVMGSRLEVHVAGTSIDAERYERPELVHTEWVADVTEAGVVVAASTASGFPFGLFAYQLGTTVDPATIDILELASAWKSDGDLSDVWMTGSESDGTSIDYHDAATTDDDPTIGIGFERAWSGTVAEGVVYRSGYISIFNDWTNSRFIQFLEDEVLGYASVPDNDEDEEQTTLGGTDSFADEVADHLEGEGYDVDRGES